MKDKTSKINQWNNDTAKDSTPFRPSFVHLFPQYTHHYETFPYSVNTIVTFDGEVIDKQSYHVDSRSHKVIYNGNTTIVILEDGSKGVAKRNPNDKYDKYTGYTIAKTRAQIAKLEKELKELTQ